MRHRKSGIKLNRTSSHREAMFRNMATSLFKYDRIRTTDAKAKELRRLADHLITLAKRGDLHARRQALSILMEKKVVHKLFDEAQDRFGSIAGGYTRIVKIGRRPGDAAPVSLIELIGASEEKKKKARKKKVKPEVEKPAVTKERAPETKTAETVPESGAVSGEEDLSETGGASAESTVDDAEPVEAAAGDAEAVKVSDDAGEEEAEAKVSPKAKKKPRAEKKEK